MRPSEILSEKPHARTLWVYYGVAFSIIGLSAIGVIVALNAGKASRVEWWVPFIGVVGGLCILAAIGFIHLEMLNAVYAVTTTSAHARWGLLIKHDESIQLGAVRSIKISQGPLQRLFKLGDLVLYTTSNDVLVFWDIAQPAQKKELIWEMVQGAAARRQPRFTPDR